MSRKVLMVCAMQEEMNGLLSVLEEQEVSYLVNYDKEKNKIYSFQYDSTYVEAHVIGITYFNAGRLARILGKQQVPVVVYNFGTCASLVEDPIGTVIEAYRFRSADLFSKDIGYHDGTLCPLSGTPYAKGNLQVSGSRFLSSKEDVAAVLKRFPDARAFDMETFMWNQVCTEYGIPFVSIRAVSDGGDESIAGSFERNVLKASKISAKKVLDYLKDPTIPTEE